MNNLARQILKRHHLQPLSERVSRLRAFFAGPLGQRLLMSEQAILNNHLELVFGFNLLQMSAVTDQDLTHKSKAKHKIKVGFATEDMGHADICANTFHLPFATDSVDGVVLHHMLEFSASPHDILKEVKRIVRPGGDILIVGLNPFSMFGFAAAIGQITAHDFWNNHVLSVRQLVDWLTLLDISVSVVEYTFFKPPCNREVLPELFEKIESYLLSQKVSLGAGVYILSAKNEYIPMTPIKLNWHVTNPEFGGAVKGGYCSDTLRSLQK